MDIAFFKPSLTLRGKLYSYAVHLGTGSVWIFLEPYPGFRNVPVGNADNYIQSFTFTAPFSTAYQTRVYLLMHMDSLELPRFRGG